MGGRGAVFGLLTSLLVISLWKDAKNKGKGGWLEVNEVYVAFGPMS